MTAEASPHEGYTAGPGLACLRRHDLRIHGSKAQRGQGTETTAPAPKGDEPMAFAEAPRTRGAGGMHARCEAIPPSIHVLASASLDTDARPGGSGPRPKEGPQPLPQLPQTAGAVPAGCRFKRETSKTVLPFSGFVFGHLPDLTGGFGCRSLSGSKFENRVGSSPGTAGGSERVRRPVMRSFRLPIQVRLGGLASARASSVPLYVSLDQLRARPRQHFHQSRHDDIDRLHAHVVRHRARLLFVPTACTPPRVRLVGSRVPVKVTRCVRPQHEHGPEALRDVEKIKGVCRE